MKTTSTDKKTSAEKLTDRQRRFAEFVATGETKVQAFTLAGYSSRGATAMTEASKLMKNPGVKAYLAELREPQKAWAVLTRQRKRELLCDVAEGRVPGTTVADRIRAIQVDNLLAGHNQPIQIEGEITLKRVLDEIGREPFSLPGDRE